MQEHNKCALIQATGTGKSYIIAKYIEEHKITALVIVPTNAILDAWAHLTSGQAERVNIITYQAFAREPYSYIDYDMIVADEMHHLGSEVWGRMFVETYLKGENHKIIGLTATEIRYLDNSRDMSEEIFENLRIDGCDLPTAINDGILPTFKYVSALYCDEKDFDEWREKTKKIGDIEVRKRLEGSLEASIKNMVSVKQAVDENLTDDYKKIIVFMNNVESKESALKMFKEVFPGASFYDVDYSKGKKENTLQMDRFKADKSRAVLFAVDMLNEGIHIKGVDCVIMFRKTISPQVYLQQMGRALASGTDKMPVIFDFVGNISNITTMGDSGESENDGFVEKLNRQIKEKERKIIIKYYSKDIYECLKEIMGRTGWRRYSESEINYIKDNYKTLGAKKIANDLNRSIGSVMVKARELGLQGACMYWTEYEDAYLKKYYKSLTNKEIAKKLGRTARSVSGRARLIGVRKTCCMDKKIKEEEISDVLKSIEACGLKETSKKYEVDKSTLAWFLKKRGLYSPGPHKRSVVALTKDGVFVKEFDSILDGGIFAKKGKDKKAVRNISSNLRGRNKTAYGYKWMYKEDYEKMIAEKDGAGEIAEDNPESVPAPEPNEPGKENQEPVAFDVEIQGGKPMESKKKEQENNTITVDVSEYREYLSIIAGMHNANVNQYVRMLIADDFKNKQKEYKALIKVLS